jgi:hypothetical protein
MFANTQSLKNRRKYQQRSDLAWSEKPTGLFFFVGWGKKGRGINESALYVGDIL